MPPSLQFPSPPPGLFQDRGWFWRAVGRTYFSWSGWRIEGPFPDVPKCVAVVAPHTSNWDFPLGLALVFATHLRVSWLGKHSLFKPPFAGFLRWMGGIPVDRRANHGVVSDCVQAFMAAPALLMALAPEGTRKGVSRWRTGFYQIAVGAGVPILPVGFDFKDHVVRLMPLFHPSGDLERDLPLIQALFHTTQGLRARPADVDP